MITLSIVGANWTSMTSCWSGRDFIEPCSWLSTCMASILSLRSEISAIVCSFVNISNWYNIVLKSVLLSFMLLVLLWGSFWHCVCTDQALVIICVRMPFALSCRQNLARRITRPRYKCLELILPLKWCYYYLFLLKLWQSIMDLERTSCREALIPSFFPISKSCVLS